MADEIIGARLEVKGTESMGNLRKEIKAAKEELISAQKQFGEYSNEAVKAAQRLAQLKDSIQEANETAELFDPGKKFQAFTGVINSLAGGFAAVQGAMGLLGVESKEVEKQLLKVQSALALSQGLSTILDSIKDFQRLAAVLMTFGPMQKVNAAANTLAAATMRLFGVATTQTSVAFNVLKGAILGTGIGALVVILGTAIQYMLSFSKSTEDAAERVKRFNEALTDTYKQVRDGELAQLARDEAIEVKRAELARKSQVEIAKIHEDYAKRRLKAQQDYYNANGTNDNKAFQDRLNAQNAYEISKLDTQQKADEEALKRQKEREAKAKAAADKAAAERKAALEAALQVEQDVRSESYLRTLSEEDQAQVVLTQKYAERIKILEKAGRETNEAVRAYEEESLALYKEYRNKEVIANREAEKQKRADRITNSSSVSSQYSESLQQFLEFADKEKMGYDKRLEGIKEFNRQVLEDEELTAEDRNKLEKESSEARIQIQEKEKQARLATLQVVSSALDSFAQLAGEQTAAGKTLAIAAATVSTILAAQQAYTAVSSTPYVGPVLGAIAAAGALAAGYARIREITRIRIPFASSGGGGSPSLPGGGGGGSALNFGSNPLATSPTTPLLASGGSGMSNMLGNIERTTAQTAEAIEKLNTTLNNGSIKATVVEGEVKAASQRTQTIEEGAQI